MSYTEFLRRKAAAAPKIIDTTVRSDASTITMRRRLQANREFFTSTRQGVINNVSDPSGTGTTSLLKSARVTTKQSGGRIPDASMFTAFMGGDAINGDGGVFQTPQRYIANSNNAGSISSCVTINEPVPFIPQGTTVSTTTTTITQLDNLSSEVLTVGFSPYTVPGNVKTVSLQPGKNVTISGAISSINITGFTFNILTNTVTATTASTAGIVNGTSIVVFGGTASPGNLGTFTVTSFVENVSVTYTNASGGTEVETAIATFTSPNNGTYPILSVNSLTQITVSNPNAITDSGPNVYFGNISLTLSSTGEIAPNTIPQNASNITRTREFCVQPSTEPHVQNELGPPLFVDNTIRLKYMTSCCNTVTAGGNGLLQPGVPINLEPNHQHPGIAILNHSHVHHPRPLKGNGGIPVFTVSSPDDARKVGDFNPRNIPYVEKHHGNDLKVNPRRVPTKFQIPENSPAQLKINDPRHYPVA